MTRVQYDIFAILFAAALAWLLSQGCADEPRAERPDEPIDRPGCSFSAVLGAWEDAFGERVPAECELLDREYDVYETSIVSCDGSEPRDGELVIGCTRPAERAIYVLSGRDEIDVLDTLIHEWTHALSECALGDPDAPHLRAGLWARYGAESVEITAAADIGRCLSP